MSKISNINDAYDDLCRDLEGKPDIHAISSEFGALSTNYERVEFAKELLHKNNYYPKYLERKKDNAESVKYRQEGNNLFATQKDFEAYKSYNRSIAYAESNSEQLGLGYANRSAILLENNLHVECLKDIELALQYGYPSKLSAKLEERKHRALQLQKNGYPTKEKYYLPPPPLSFPKNSYFECASDCIEFKHSETIGRHLVATKEIVSGDVIAVEAPYISILLKQSYLTHCSNCLDACYNLIPCLHCPLVMFCSPECREQAWAKFHRFECRILFALHSIDVEHIHLLALRVVIQARGYVNDLMKNSTIRLCNDSYKSQRYDEIHNLVTNAHLRSRSNLFMRAVFAVVLKDCLEMSDFFDGLNDDVEEAKRTVGGMILQHLLTAPSNMHNINQFCGKPDEDYKLQEIGAGAFSFMSLINHACVPNVIRHCHGTSIVLRALSTIKPGQQLYDDYGYLYAVMERAERQENLKRQYFFECKCVACEENWPLFKNLPDEDEEVAAAVDDFQRLEKADREFALEKIPLLTKKMRELEGTAPSQLWSYYQESMKKCFAVCGNKYTCFK